MLVRDVLVSKNRSVIAIDPAALVSEAIAKLVQNNIGSLPVVDAAGHLIGIFSERDVLRIIHNRGEGFGRLPVSEVMTRDPITCSAELVGIVSVGDVIKVLYDKLHAEHQHLMTYIHGGVA
jgi:CBS domain-containing protein